ncbi:hypothetical protein BH11ACT2_BH11ACT2_19790 [soil metagenome]
MRYRVNAVRAFGAITGASSALGLGILSIVVWDILLNIPIDGYAAAELLVLVFVVTPVGGLVGLVGSSIALVLIAKGPLIACSPAAFLAGLLCTATLSYVAAPPLVIICLGIVAVLVTFALGRQGLRHFVMPESESAADELSRTRYGKRRIVRLPPNR